MTRPRVVIVGNGMAGARVVANIRDRDPDNRIDISVFGAEPGAAYNRVMLSSVLAGRRATTDIGLLPDGWHEQHDVALQPENAVVRIDRQERHVELVDGSFRPYDALVLATGARARIPNIRGLYQGGDPSELVPGVFAFRTMRDCDAIRQATGPGHRVVVLGGGLLGIEAARGLAAQGTPVVIVHGATHLMERQLDYEGGQVLAKALERLGVTIRMAASASSIVPGRGGCFGGLGLDDGSCVLGDTLIISTGAQPNIELADESGLRVDTGIVVDDSMRSPDDPRVFALGDCAQHRGQTYGLAAPAWEQAVVVADQVTGTDPSSQYRGSRVVTRLKADGLELASLGDPHAVADDLDVVHVADPSRGTYARVLMRSDRVVGAIMLGQIAGRGTITTLFDRDAALPNDRLSLLMPIEAAESAIEQVEQPSRMPATTVVCNCNNVTKATIQECVLGGARTVDAVASRTRATTGCGGCKDIVEGIVDWVNAAEPALNAVPEVSAPDGVDEATEPAAARSTDGFETQLVEIS